MTKPIFGPPPFGPFPPGTDSPVSLALTGALFTMAMRQQQHLWASQAPIQNALQGQLRQLWATGRGCPGCQRWVEMERDKCPQCGRDVPPSPAVAAAREAEQKARAEAEARKAAAQAAPPAPAQAEPAPAPAPAAPVSLEKPQP